MFYFCNGASQVTDWSVWTITGASVSGKHPNTAIWHVVWRELTIVQDTLGMLARHVVTDMPWRAACASARWRASWPRLPWLASLPSCPLRPHPLPVTQPCQRCSTASHIDSLAPQRMTAHRFGGTHNSHILVHSTEYVQNCLRQ